MNRKVWKEKLVLFSAPVSKAEVSDVGHRSISINKKKVTEKKDQEMCL